VINKLVKDTVVLTPDNKALNIAISWEPKPVNLGFEEKGVIKVQPDIVKIELEHLVKKIFFFLIFIVFKDVYQKEFGYKLISTQFKYFNGINVYTLKLLKLIFFLEDHSRL